MTGVAGFIGFHLIKALLGTSMFDKIYFVVGIEYYSHCR
ncbi:hypothetical protein M917_2033 [Psychrobacter aquaticus CMS 56]|uniref:Uncharacterized protein n=1 Tax=Psychrobacter aquaticus CMS 56 TaxID=1354303 RepID=U4T1N1_9GAMM|nr:hypothetical protein M917_2033 [Psychrobacter aquaticus CMS 56]